MIHKHICRCNSLTDRIGLHGIHFIIILPAVIAAHEQLRCSAKSMQLHSLPQAVVKHIAWHTAIVNQASQYQDAVHIRKLRRFLGGKDPSACRADHDAVDPRHSGDPQYTDHHQNNEDP